MGQVAAHWDDDEKTIIRMIFEGRWTWDDFYAADRQVIDMEKEGGARIDIIVDLLSSGPLPQNTLLHVKNIADRQSDKMGLNVLVTTSPLIRNLYGVGAKFYEKIGQYFIVVPTIEDARLAITEARRKIGFS